MDKRLTLDSEVWYADYHNDVFQLQWDNDIVNLNKNDVEALKIVLEDWGKK